MDFTIFLRKDFLRQNGTVKEMLSRYDNDGGYSDGLFSKKEAYVMVTDAVEPIFLGLFGRKNIVRAIYKYLDKDNGYGKDGYISYQEIAQYISETYNLKLSEIGSMTIEQACDKVAEAYEKKKKSKKNN